MAVLHSLFLIFFATSRASAKSSSAPPSLKSRIHGAYFGALVADSLCLGSHYEYDAPTIKKAYSGTIQKYLAPGENMGGSTHGVGWGRRNYHPGQKKGDNTDYGMYNELILKYLHAHSRKGEKISLKKLVPMWQKIMEAEEGDPEYWGAWKCTQTRQALEKVQMGETKYKNLGGHSNAMSVRSAALPAVFTDENQIVKAARVISFTHTNEEALLGTEFFTRVVWELTHGASGVEKRLKPSEAIAIVEKKMANGFISEQIKKGVAKYEEVMDISRPLGEEEFVDDLAMTSMARLWEVGKSEPIKVGKASPTEGTMPSSIYMILKYTENTRDVSENAFATGARANAMVGGDNASRAVAVGMVLGAYYGAEGITSIVGDEHLKTGLNAWKRGEKMLNELMVIKKTEL